MISRSSSAHSISAARRAGASTAPVGNWWAGVSSTAEASVAASSSHAQAALVDRDRHHLQARLLDDQPVLVPAGVLERDPLDAAPAQRAAQQREALHEAGAHEHVLGVGVGAAHPAQVPGERFAQVRQPARVAVAERIQPRVAQRRAQRAQPDLAREVEQVGQAGVEVVGEALQQRARRWALARGAHGLGDPHRRPLAGREIALGGELPVGLAHHPARDAELLGEPARGGQARVRGQASRADLLAQRALELLVQRQLIVAGRAPRAAPALQLDLFYLPLLEL